MARIRPALWDPGWPPRQDPHGGYLTEVRNDFDGITYTYRAPSPVWKTNDHTSFPIAFGSGGNATQVTWSVDPPAVPGYQIPPPKPDDTPELDWLRGQVTEICEYAFA